MEPAYAQRSGVSSAAPYGQACAGCSRAKCKCFYLPDGSGCERCQRLSRVCEPSPSVRKRKLHHGPRLLQTSGRTASSLEDKLDDIVSLLRAQAAEKIVPTQGPTPGSSTSESNTPSSLTSLNDVATYPGPLRGPEIVIDTSGSFVNLQRPSETTAAAPAPLSPIPGDVAAHTVPERMAEAQLQAFRRSFLSQFPFVHISETTTAAHLRHQRPFLWLVIMCLTTNQVAEQFVLEAAVWHIVSRRIVAERHADLDVLLGLVFFASWSHYFKEDRPFMTMFAQMAVSLVLELGLQTDTPTSTAWFRQTGRLLSQAPPRQQPRTLEERRTLLAVFVLTSTTWTTYRKTEPLRWTVYMDDCVRIISEARETPLDSILIAQVKCHIITNQLTSPSGAQDGGDSIKTASSGLLTAMLRQVGEIRHGLPDQISSERAMRFYLHNAELTVREAMLQVERAHDPVRFSQFQRLQALDSVLCCVESWLAAFFDMPLADWVGISVETFTQFTHCMVVLFKLTTIREPDWDLDEVKRRADVFKILDRTCEAFGSIPKAVGMVDAEGPRSGIFFKTPILIRAIKSLFLAGMPPENEGAPRTLPDLAGDEGPSPAQESWIDSIPDGFLASLSEEPWLQDVFDFASEPDHADPRSASSGLVFQRW